jgi:hypothetical protein
MVHVVHVSTVTCIAVLYRVRGRASKNSSRSLGARGAAIFGAGTRSIATFGALFIDSATSINK